MTASVEQVRSLQSFLRAIDSKIDKICREDQISRGVKDPPPAIKLKKTKPKPVERKRHHSREEAKRITSEAIRRHDQGEGIKSIAHDYDLCVSSVRRWMNAAGYRFEDRNAVKQREWMVKMVRMVNEEGWTLAQAQRRIGSCMPTVRQRIDRAGYAYDGKTRTLIKVNQGK